jgi:hypothetical protein
MSANGDEALVDSVGKIRSRADLVALIYALQDDLKQHRGDWENLDLATYLGALAAWLNDADGYYRNFKLNVSADVPSWRLFADCLIAARVYE